ncbi:glutamine amidotransferase class-II [Gloeothece citriformis PCC 7424]|uniref:Glutamine amidotransferase class-II n=1 Tax=Gloeothece citriformis (strain PCC 7424) TaxID=65393 RepID=B7KIW4_GLOC7|nr:ergothioneine biosynthesis protein EgtC [Gloeothece citriformis]ACK70800.1 glutamine amidotransferase class-II [Gloeothece citriformis PCC 7424]
MCRLIGYLGSVIPLDQLLYKPEHSLVVQSYKPQEMTAGLLNADGFGIGWYHGQKDAKPYIYKNILPIWSDNNLANLSRYVETGCTLAYVRSATPPLAVDYSNCQPFTHNQILFIHNGFIHNFRTSLYRPIRYKLDDTAYQLILGSTDSEHIFALVIDEIEKNPGIPLETALRNTLLQLIELAKIHSVYFSANIIVSDGKQLVASRYSNRLPTPTLYWLRDDPLYPDGVIIASEPLFKGNWNKIPEASLITVTEGLEVEIKPVVL